MSQLGPGQSWGDIDGDGDPDFYLDYVESKFDNSDDVDFLVKRVLLAAYLRMLRLFPTDHPDQSPTQWPAAPRGERLTSHEDIVDATEALLARSRKSDVAELTDFLYELREFDRTRRLTAETEAGLRSYRLSQALWASRIELGSRTISPLAMDPELVYFVLPQGIHEHSAAAP